MVRPDWHMPGGAALYCNLWGKACRRGLWVRCKARCQDRQRQGRQEQNRTGQTERCIQKHMHAYTRCRAKRVPHQSSPARRPSPSPSSGSRVAYLSRCRSLAPIGVARPQDAETMTHPAVGDRGPLAKDATPNNSAAAHPLTRNQKCSRVERGPYDERKSSQCTET